MLKHKKIQGALIRVKESKIKKQKQNISTHCLFMPITAQIEITNLCNLSCKWCFRNNPEMIKHGIGSMDIDDFKSIVGQLKGVRELHLFGGGEPLLYKELIEAINYSKNYIPFVSITTNAVLLDNEMANKLASSSLSELGVSIDGADKETYKMIREADFDKVVENIKYFRSKSDIPINIKSVVSKQNLKSLEYMPELVKELEANALHFQLLHESDSSDISNLTSADLNEEELQNFTNIVMGKCRKLKIITNVESLISSFRIKYKDEICRAPFFTTYVNYKGYLTPCCSWTDNNLSNVFESSFHKSWNSKEMKDFRKKMINQDYPEHCKKWCKMKSKDQ